MRAATVTLFAIAATAGLLAMAQAAVMGAPRKVAGMTDGFRPPSVPLIVWDPYMSVWSNANNLTDEFTVHWTGTIMCFIGAIRIDETVYRFMGPTGAGMTAPAMQQVSVSVFPTSTQYIFQQDGVQLTVTFTTPAFPSDFSRLSLPYTYLTFHVTAIDGQSHSVKLYYDNTAEVAVSNVLESVEWGSSDSMVADAYTMWVGTQAQNVLGMSGDFVKINWGYAYTATPTVSGVQWTTAGSASTRNSFLNDTSLPPIDNRQPRAASDDWIVLAYTWDLGVVAAGSEVSNFLVFAYDDIYSIKYFGTPMRPLWRHAYDNCVSCMLQDAIANYTTMMEATAAQDASILASLSKVGGDKYATLCALVYRQTTGATKLVWNAAASTTWMFMKEISSDGDVSTVDVVFPSSPFWALLATDALKAMMFPLLEYGNNGTSVAYNLSWAPHHLGTWPIAYILPTQQEQMPIEETGNMLFMLASIVGAEGTGDMSWLLPYWDLVDIWGQYLMSALPDPENQLCTDDFEGPSPHNVNLAAKGIAALGAYAYLSKAVGNTTAAASAMTAAEGFVQYWESHANDNGHYRLQYNLPNTWSQKYNLLYHQYLDLGLFPDTVLTAEEAFYPTKANQYGIPLDNRATFTKTDWQSWIGAMGSEDQFQTIISWIYDFANTSPSRVPFTDWYDTVKGTQTGFQARPVMGGLYARALLQSK